ncbi:MAG: MiaB/RimO family radical SAM methylthiotransferase [Dehalococcoidaceae bacterium]|nr:MiaB/RimO family radical SAM methylthiotransferase [Dehalococcoidaceae bacterium]
MNRAESERLSAMMEKCGFSPAGTPEKADFVLLNSCVVRASAENRVVNKLAYLGHLKKSDPEKVIALTGCFVSDDTASLKKRFPFVNYFFPAGHAPRFDEAPAPETGCLPARAGISSFIPIIQGCNNFCSYCIVPYRRGREVSRPLAEIVTEAKTLVERGAREIILLGQNVDSYGHDLDGIPDLSRLLEELNRLDGLERIRFLTNHPKDMSSRLIRSMASLEKVCEQLNLPVQAGSDKILAAMGRGYNLARFMELVSELRTTVPGVAITTDIIVGFPGEDEALFEKTLKFLENTRFDAVHVAMYSPRPGTRAARELADDVPAAEKSGRLKMVEALQARIAMEASQNLVGSRVEVLVEGRKKGKWYGRSRSDKPVFFEHNENWLGKLASVKIEHASSWSLVGSIDNEY